VSNPGPRAAGAIAPFAGFDAPLPHAMSLAVRVALARAIGGPPRLPNRPVWAACGSRGLLLVCVGRPCRRSACAAPCVR